MYGSCIYYILCTARLLRSLAMYLQTSCMTCMYELLYVSMLCSCSIYSHAWLLQVIYVLFTLYSYCLCPWLFSSRSPAGPTVASDLAISVNSSLPSLATEIKANQRGTIWALQHSWLKVIDTRLVLHAAAIWCRPLSGEQIMESIWKYIIILLVWMTILLHSFTHLYSMYCMDFSYRYNNYSMWSDSTVEEVINFNIIMHI